MSISITSPRNVDIQYEIDQKSEEILEVRYEPKIPGIYCISVTFNNQEIPQSPIKVYIEPDIDVGKIKITGIDQSKVFFFFVLSRFIYYLKKKTLLFDSKSKIHY